jgi:type VI secretion system secreted protein VgrG
MKSKFLILVAFAMLLYGSSTGLAGPSVLGSAQSFAVLGGSTVTNTGPTTITGNLGVSPGSAVTGFPPGIVNGGTTYGPGAESSQAQSDVTKAYNALAGLAPHGNKNSGILTGTDLGGLTLQSGVYFFADSAQLTGKLTLDAQGNDNAYWVFQIGSTLTTASSSSVEMFNLGSNDGIGDGVFWQVGSSATLGTGTTFEGNILALTSITLNTGATIPNGRALAQNGAVTLGDNVISIICPNGGPGYSGGLEFENGVLVPIGITGPTVVPVPGAFLLVAIGMASLSVFRKRTLILK